MAPESAGQEPESGLGLGAGVAVMAGQGEPVAPEELNAWRRGFTPQAEIWNGRLAMLGLSVGITVLLVARLLS